MASSLELSWPSPFVSSLAKACDSAEVSDVEETPRAFSISLRLNEPSLLPSSWLIIWDATEAVEGWLGW